jgi:hypothetical protein
VTRVWIAGCCAVLAILCAPAVVFAQGSVDFSGAWVQTATFGPAGGAGAETGWGPSIVIRQTSRALTVSRGPDTVPSVYRFDTADRIVSLETIGCNKRRFATRARWQGERVVITERVLRSTACGHPSTAEFPTLENGAANDVVWIPHVAGGGGTPGGPLMATTTLTRSGDVLTIEIVMPRPDGGNAVTTSVYRPGR